MRLDLLPKTFDGKMNHVCEEAAEFIRARMKYSRFGAVNTDNGIVYNNIQDMYDELQNLRFAVAMAIGTIEKDYMTTVDVKKRFGNARENPSSSSS